VQWGLQNNREVNVRVQDFQLPIPKISSIVGNRCNRLAIYLSQPSLLPI